MLYSEIRQFLSTFIDIEEKNESFDYNLNDSSSLDNYTNELHKFNQIYNSFFMFNNRLVYMFNNYEILLKSDDLKQIVKLYNFYKSKKHDNSLLLAEFLLSYYNSINTNEYKKNVSKYKEARKNFIEIAIKPHKKIIDTITQDAYKLYNLIIDYGVKQDNFFLGEILERSCINLKKHDELKKNIIKKFLDNKLYISKVVKYDDNINENISYYEEYINSLKQENIYSRFPESILYILDSKNLLSKSMFNVLLNKMIDRINDIQNRSLDEKESFIQILANIDETVKVLNSYLNRLKHLELEQKNKIHECLKNILYIKRCILSDQEKMNSQMQEFKYEQVIPNEEIEKFVSAINESIGGVYSASCGNFVRKLELAIHNYSEYPTSYIFSSYNIDSEMQVYPKSDEGIEKSIFKDYYDKRGKEYSQKHPELKNIITKDYYELLLKFLKHDFITSQHFMLLFFDNKEGNRSLISKLISKGNYKINNDYIILAMNVSQIENGIVKILKSKGRKLSKNGSTNLNELADDYENDDAYFNGLMYINYILYERHGLNIRNNISHGNYFKKNVEVEIMTTICAIMFLNNLIRKECDICD